MRKSPKSDPQRNEVYAWESKFVSACTASMTDTRVAKMVREVCSEYGIKKPKLGPLRRKERDYAGVCDPNTEMLRFAPTWRSAHIVLHELAHWILLQFGFGGDNHHNPLWLGVFLRLLHEYKTLPLCASVPSAKKAGLQFLKPEKCTPAMLRLATRLAAAKRRAS